MKRIDTGIAGFVINEITDSNIEFEVKTAQIDKKILKQIKALNIIYGYGHWDCPNGVNKYCLYPCKENLENFLELDFINQDIRNKVQHLLDGLAIETIAFNREINFFSHDKSRELRDYQKDDLKKLINLKRGCNFSEQRTGKTPTTILLCENLGKKTLVIAPPSLILMTWIPQIKEWTNKEAITTAKIVKNTYKPLNKTERIELYNNFFTSDNSDYLIVSKDTWKMDLEMIDKNILKDFILIVDEAHYLKGLKTGSRSTKQGEKVLETSILADRVYLLTGTPIINYPSDIFGILRVLKPTYFQNWPQFIFYFWDFDAYNNPLKFYRKPNFEKIIINFLEPLQVMHKQRDVMNWLPETQKDIVLLPMLPKQEKEYIQTCKAFHWSNAAKDEILGLLQKIRPISNGIFEHEKYISNKIEWLKSYLDDAWDNEKTLILSNFSNKTLSYLQNEIKKHDPLLIVGSTPQQKRLEIINKIQKNKESKILIANIKCIKEGITLDKIDTLIFIDRSWSPADNEQAIMRFLPTTSADIRDRNKQIIDLVSFTKEVKNTFLNINFGSIDEYVVDTLYLKKELSVNINNMTTQDEN